MMLKLNEPYGFSPSSDASGLGVWLQGGCDFGDAELRVFVWDSHVQGWRGLGLPTDATRADAQPGAAPEPRITLKGAGPDVRIVLMDMNIRKVSVILTKVSGPSTAVWVDANSTLTAIAAK